MKKVVIVVPAYNESESLDAFYNSYSRFNQDNRGFDFNLLFVNDGSCDNTLDQLRELSLKDQSIKYLSFSRNFGHQAALRAGLENSVTLDPDCVVSMDADLQHPFEVILEFLRKWESGAEIVYSVRKDSKDCSGFKRLTSKGFYKVLNILGEVEIDEGCADFRLLDIKVVNKVLEFKEADLFFRGLVPFIGFKQESVEYQPHKREFGQTKYTLSKMFKLAVTGITSFSVKPLYISILLGIMASVSAFLYLIYSLVAKFYWEQTVSGWTSIIISVLFIGGVQLVVLGIIGIYIGKIFNEVKNRPHYLVSEDNLNS